MQEALQTLATEFDLGTVEYDAKKNLVTVTDPYDKEVTEGTLSEFLMNIAAMAEAAESLA